MTGELLPDRPGFWLSAARWIVSGANSLAHLVPLLVVSPFSRGLAWTIYRHWARTMCRIFGIVPVLRDDNDGGDSGSAPCVYVWLNQTSLSEVPAFALLLPPWYTIANVGYAIMPLFGWAMLPLRNIVIIRQWKWQAKRGIERAAARLAQGERWLVSIEGARSLDGELQPYKKGPIVMALRSHATIVPLAVQGAREILPRGDWRLRPGRIEAASPPGDSHNGLDPRGSGGRPRPPSRAGRARDGASMNGSGALSEIKSYRAIGPRLGTAGQPTPSQLAAVRAAGFEAVINLAVPTSQNAVAEEGSIVAALGMSYVHIPVDFKAPTSQDFDTFCHMMRAFGERPVFVHCALNMRVSAFVFLYRVLHEGVAPAAAEPDLRAIWAPDAVWSRFIQDQLARGADRAG